MYNLSVQQQAKLNSSHSHQEQGLLSSVRLTAALQAISSNVKHWLLLAKTRHSLSKLNQEQLADVGLTQTQAAHESQKPFWKE